MLRSISVDSCSTSDTFPPVSFIQDEVSEDEKNLVTEFRKLELSGQLEVEPLLKADKSRFVLFPIQHDDVSYLKYKIKKYNYFIYKL
jgi:hypothetical protein